MRFKISIQFILFHLILAEGADKITLKPTVCAVKQFNAEDDARTLHNILKGSSNHLGKLRDILTRRDTAQRLRIVSAHNNIIDQSTSITSIVRDKLHSHYESIVRRMLLPHEEIRYIEIIKAFTDGDHVNLDSIVDTLCPLTQDQYTTLNDFFNRREKKTLLSYIHGQHSRNNWSKTVRKKIINYCMYRYTGDVEWQKNTWCKDHYTETISIFNDDKTDRRKFEDRLNLVLFNCTTEQIRDIATKTDLITKTQKTLHDSSDFKFVAVTLIRSAVDINDYAAETFHEAVLGANIQHTIVIKNLVLYCNSNLGNIQESYETKFKGVNLRDRILKDLPKTTENQKRYRRFIKELLRDPSKDLCDSEADPLPQDKIIEDI